MLKKHCLVNMLFLVCFVIYSVSPVFSSLHDKYSDKISNCQTNNSIKNHSLFLVGLLLDYLSQGNMDGFPDSEEDGEILTTKKGIVLSAAFQLLKNIPAHKLVKIFDVPVAEEQLSYHPDNKISLQKGFNRLHSGTSPPSA